jgi:hypothetical protein
MIHGCWIRVLQMPFGLMNRDTTEVIGAEFGGLLEVETEDDGSAAGKYLRIKVNLDIRVPLRRGIKLIVEEDKAGEEEEQEDTGKAVVDAEGNHDMLRWCPFQYEFLPNFCYLCGLLGHKKDYCQTCDRKSKKFKYGPELIARRFGEDRGRPAVGGFGGSWGELALVARARAEAGTRDLGEGRRTT